MVLTLHACKELQAEPEFPMSNYQYFVQHFVTLFDAASRSFVGSTLAMDAQELDAKMNPTIAKDQWCTFHASSSLVAIVETIIIVKAKLKQEPI